MKTLVTQIGSTLSTHKSFHILPNLPFSPRLCSFTNNPSISQPSPVVPATFVSHLEHCQDINSLRKLHACVVTFGFQNHIFLGSKLLNTYAKLGSLAESRWVFNTIVNKDLSLWNSALVGYFRTGYFEEVLGLYSRLKDQKIGVVSSTITFCLKSCDELARVGFGRAIHADAFKFGFSADGFVGSTLVGFYSSHGDIEVARKAFDEISDKDVIAYTTMVTGYARAGGGQAFGAFEIVRCMHEKGFDPNRVTLVSLLQVAAQLGGLEEGRSIHGYAVRREIGCSEEVFNTSLIDMYVKCGASHAARSVFNGMPIKYVAFWNALIAGYIQVEKPLEALDLFGCMMEERVMPDLITLSNTLFGCAKLEFLRHGKSIHAYILRSGKQVDLVTATALIEMYSKCNSIHHARMLFHRMEACDNISFNVMIAGYISCKLPEKALETFHWMVEAGRRPNPATILSILTATAHMANLRVGRSIHGYIVRKELESNTEIANQTMYMYTKCECIHTARRVFNRITRRDLVSWTSMMMGYVHHGSTNEAIQLFQMMQEARMEPDSLTLISLLQACSQLGCLKSAKEIHNYLYRIKMEKEITVINSLATTYSKCGRLDMAKLLFEHSGKRGLTSWNTMLAAYGMHGNCVEALELFNQMRDEKVKPDELTFTSLISACSHAGLMEEGQRLFHAMTVEHSIAPREEHYGSMVDLYARAGRLEEAYDLVKCLTRKSASGLAALLAACKVYRNMELGEIIGKQLLDLEPDNSGAYTLLSNIYAEAGKWDEVSKLRSAAMSRSLKIQPGYSMIELDKQDSACIGSI